MFRRTTTTWKNWSCYLLSDRDEQGVRRDINSKVSHKHLHFLIRASGSLEMYSRLGSWLFHSFWCKLVGAGIAWVGWVLSVPGGVPWQAKAVLHASFTWLSRDLTISHCIALILLESWQIPNSLIEGTGGAIWKWGQIRGFVLRLLFPGKHKNFT